MAIADLLWACPLCKRDRGLRSGEPGTCQGCGARFERVRGALISARREGEDDVVRTAAEWISRLPDPATLLDGPEPVRVAAVTARLVERYETVRDAGRYLNRIEIFGEEGRGRLVLGLQSLTYTPEGAVPLTWPFDDLRAVQASSRTLQIRGGDHPLASFAFLDDSSFLWERLLALTLQRHYRATGKGEIVELQPRIAVR